MSVAPVDRVVETVRYTYRLRPGKQAQAALEAEWHRCRWLWNEAVHQEKSGTKPTLCRLSKMLTAARARCSWLRTGSQVCQQQTLRTYARVGPLVHRHQPRQAGDQDSQELAPIAGVHRQRLLDQGSPSASCQGCVHPRGLVARTAVAAQDRQRLP